MKLLLVAADPREFSGINPLSPQAIDGVRWSRSTTLGPHEALLVANGAGAQRAADAASRAAGLFHPDAVVSTGFCGALDSSLAIADIVVGDQPPAQPVSSGRPFHSGAVATINHVARTSAEKRSLRASGAIAVDMEATGVASAAKVLGLPFFCIRSVTDLASEDMANDFNAALRSDGHFDTISILTGALRHPGVRVPELLRLRNRAALAARSLGSFFVDCRFGSFGS